MRFLIVLSLLLFFSAQSLALVAPFGCGDGGDNSGEMNMPLSAHTDMSAVEGGDTELAAEMASHADMPCCDEADKAPEQAANLCQLTCAAGVCSSAALSPAASKLELATGDRPLPWIIHTPPVVSPTNLLRPPISA